MSRSSRVPRSRGSRLWRLGRMAGGVASDVLVQGARQWSSTGQRPETRDLFLTPDNARRMAQQLSEMRGAAMKMGQLLSMEAGEVLPREFVEVLDRLREDAHYMPYRQLIDCLNQAWGPEWRDHFEYFPFTPMAAASIGQVHKAKLKDGPEVAIKVQYPGVRESIDSDVDNVVRLVRWFQVFPEDMDLTPMIEEAKRQLHAEADYRQEADWLRTYRDRIRDVPGFRLPEVIEGLTTERVLTMTYVDGHPIEDVETAPAELRDRVATAMVDLGLRELLEWGLVQTDPNFANYRYDPATGAIGLLDFGATRSYGPELRDRLVTLFRAIRDQDEERMVDTAVDAGYFDPDEARRYRSEFKRLGRMAAEPMRERAPYDFGRARLSSRMRDQLLSMDFDRRFLKLPIPELMFVQRKLTGLYLLCGRLGARINVVELLDPYLERDTARAPQHTD